MKRHPQDPLNFSLLRSLDEFAKKNGLSIQDVAAQEGLIESFRTSLQTHVSHAARIHGFRVESMFAHVVAAMGEVVQISEEDAGAFFDESGNLKRPDFRIITRAREQMLVEVKSFYQKSSPKKPYSITGEYLASLKRYAALNNVPLRIAIYWSRWNLWSLIDAARLDESQKSIEITMSDAFLQNEMCLLGDRMISTLPPLSLRLYADKEKPRQVSSTGETGITIQKAGLCCNGVDIEDKEEQRIAWYLILNGNWRKVEEIAEVNDGMVDYLEMRVSPDEPPDEDTDGQPFRSLGFMSQMITSQYLRSTSDEGKVTNLSPDVQPDQFGVAIPSNYEGSVLKLWRFVIHPKHADRQALRKRFLSGL